MSRNAHVPGNSPSVSSKDKTGAGVDRRPVPGAPPQPGQPTPRRKDDPNAHQKSDAGLVVLDNPDDGEIFDTGDNADVAGAPRESHKERLSAKMKKPL